MKMLKETREEAKRMVDFVSTKDRECPRCSKSVKDDELKGNKCVYCMTENEWMGL